MDYRGVSIVSIWFFCTSIIALLVWQTGMNFTGVLMLMGIAVAMTFTFLLIGGGKEEEKIKKEVKDTITRAIRKRK